MLFAGIALACSAGCARWPIYFGPDLRRSAVNPETANIEYHLDASRLHTPVAVARVEGQQVCYEEVANSLLPDRTVGTLKIVYPCADAPVGFVRAEVQVTTDPLPNLTQFDTAKSKGSGWLSRFGRPRDAVSDAVKETWVLDLPKGELDALLGRLATPGSVVIAKKGEPAGGTLTTFFNARRSSGSCHPIPELDALMRRVRSEGELVAYTNPLLASGKRAEQPASVLAYREMRQHDEASASGLGLSNPAPQLAQTGLSMPCSAPSGRILAVRAAEDAPARR